MIRMFAQGTWQKQKSENDELKQREKGKKRPDVAELVHDLKNDCSTLFVCFHWVFALFLFSFPKNKCYLRIN